MYLAIRASLTQNALAKVEVWSEDYHINGLPSGPLFLKVIIRETDIDTRATTRHIRAKLAALKDYLPTINYNIIDFNVYVQQLIIGLKRRGEFTQDLLPNLFEAYKVATDQDFVNYIKMKENDYDEGKDVTADSLMQCAQTKYKIMVEEKKWAVPTKDQEKIIALEAKIKTLTKKGGKGDQKGKSEKGKKGKKGKGKKSDKNKSDDSNASKAPHPDWKTKAPKDRDKNKPKNMNGKEYWWCTNHKLWCLHKTSECRGVGNNPRANNNNNNNNSGGNANNNGNRRRNPNLVTDNDPITPSRHTTVRVSSALQHLAEEDSD
jgi:hypothetical protein